MSASKKKARVSSPAEEEKQELWDKYGHDACDSLANSLKKDSNITGYRYVYPVSKTSLFFHLRDGLLLVRLEEPDHSGLGVVSQSRRPPPRG